MPREKNLFFIGIWIILLSNFIGLPTEIKNYLFIATAVVLIIISYSSNISEINTKENFFHKKNTEPKLDTKKTKFEEKPKDRPAIIQSFKKENFLEREEVPSFEIRKSKKVSEEKKTEENILDSKNPFESDSAFSSPALKVRRVRKPRSKLIREEIPEEKIVLNNLEEEDDVIVISSDGDNAVS